MCPAYAHLTCCKWHETTCPPLPCCVNQQQAFRPTESNGLDELRVHRARLQLYSNYCMLTLTVRQQEAMHWSRAFTGRLTPDVKLVGSTISCEATLKDGDATKGSRQNAHVQSYAMATDQVRFDACAHLVVCVLRPTSEDSHPCAICRLYMQCACLRLLEIASSPMRALPGVTPQSGRVIKFSVAGRAEGAAEGPQGLCVPQNDWGHRLALGAGRQPCHYEGVLRHHDSVHRVAAAPSSAACGGAARWRRCGQQNWLQTRHL